MADNELDFLPDPTKLKTLGTPTPTDNSVSFLPEIQNLKSLSNGGSNIFPDSGEAPYNFFQDNPIGQSVGRTVNKIISNANPLSQIENIGYEAGTFKEALQNFPSEFSKESAGDPLATLMPMSLSNTVKAGLKSYLEASVRDVPDDQKEAAKAKVLASLLGTTGGAVIGGPIGAMGAGTLAPAVTDQIMQILGMAPDTPLQEDVEDVVASGATAAIYSPVTKATSKMTGEMAQRTASRLGNVESKIGRQQDIPMLQARALSRGANDFDVRANKAQDIASGKPITTGEGNPPVTSGPVDIDGNHPLARGVEFDADGNPYYLNQSQENLPARPQSSQIDPVTGLATIDPEVQGTGTRRSTSGSDISDADVLDSITVDLHDSAMSGPKTIKLNEALPEIQEVFKIKRPRGDVYPQGRSEFDLYAKNVQDQKRIQSREIDKAIDAVPSSVKFKNRDIYGSLFRKIEEGFTDREIKPSRDVAINEVMRAAERDFSPLEAKAFKKVFKRLRLDEGGGYSLNVHVTPQMKAVYINLRDKLLDYGHDAKSVKKLKSEFDKASNWKGATDSEAVGRTQAYRELANSARGQLARTIASANPALGERYNAANRKYTVLSTVEPLVEKTARIASLKGRDWMVGMNPADTNFDIPLISSLKRNIEAITYPQIYSPEAMMKAADTSSFNYSTRNSLPNVLARGARPLVSGGAKGMGLASEGLEQLSTPIGSSVVGTSLSNSRENREVENQDTSWVDTFKNGWDSIKGFFSPADANAQEPDELQIQQRLSQPIPRSTNAISDPVGQSVFLKKLEQVASQPIMPQEPTEATMQRARGMVQDAQTVLASGDKASIAQLMVSINKMFPGQVFEQGRFASEWDGKLYDEEEKINYSAQLREQLRTGELSASQVAMQISSLNDPADGRLLF